MANKTPLVAFLLSHGANPNLNLHAEEFTALEMAPKVETDLEITSLLLQKGAVVKGRSSVLHAAQNGRVDIMGKLHDAGGSLNDAPDNPDIFDDRRKQADWGTPLHGATVHGQTEAVKWLLGRGAKKGSSLA
jgi:ankyrin repeat protein